MNKTNVSLIGMTNGHELLQRYLNEHAGIIHEHVYDMVDKMTWHQAVVTLEEYDPTVRFVDYTPCNGVHVLTFGEERTTLRITPMFCQQASYTVTLDNEDAYIWVRDLLGSNMYHLMATPA